MKKIPYKNVTIALAATALLVIPVLFIALFIVFHIPFKCSNYDPHLVKLAFENAPEGTVYIDPLIKIDSSDENYVEFAAAPKVVKYNNGKIISERALNIDADSEIARLNADGYVSMPLHYKYSDGVEIYDDYICFLTADTTENIEDIRRGYGEFKAAYVDENGRVLGITDAAGCSYDRSEPYTLTADDNKLSYNICGIAPLQETIIDVAAAAECISLAALAVFVILAPIKKIGERITERKMSE